MQIPFTAYAEDCTVNGEVDLPGDRLSDFLSSTTEFVVAKPSFRALDDGRVVEGDTCDVLRDDLHVVIATGPRGRPERRVWTRQHPVRARVGPYQVVGYLHAAPTIDPLHGTDRRQIVALTDSVVEYTEAGVTVRIEAATVLLNCTKINRLENATDEDVGLARHLERDVAVDPRARDLTGNV
jgi:hypothetical protein